MAGLLKRFKGKQKSSEKETNHVATKGPSDSRNIDESSKDGIKSASLSPSTSGSEISPQHDMITHSSLFSGMKLTKSARKHEPDTSPYIIITGETDETDSQDQQKFDSQNQGEGTTGSSGFSFLSQEPPPLGKERDEDDATPMPDDTMEKLEEDTGTASKPSSGFSFLSSNTNKNTDADPANGDHEVPSQPIGFSFLSTDSHPNDDNKNQIPLQKSEKVVDMAIHSTETDSQFLNSFAKTDSRSSLPATLTPPLSSPIPKVPQKVGRQVPPNKKKKKQKAIRPGQERSNEIYSGMMETSVTSDLDGLSLSSSHGSSSVDVPLTVDRMDGEDGRSEDPLIREDPMSPPVIVPSNVSTLQPSQLGSIGGGGGSEDKGDVTSEASGDTLVTISKGDGAGEGTLVNNGEGDGVGEGTLVNNGEGKRAYEEELVQLDTNQPTAIVDKNTSESPPPPPPSEHIIPSELVEVFSGGVAETELDKDDSSSSSRTGNYTVELSPMEKIATLLQAAKSNAEAISADSEETGKQYGTTVERNIGTIKKLINRRHHVKELKAKEAAALSEENYELAEDLRQELESVSVGNDWGMLMETQTCVEQWLKQCGTLMSSEIALHIEVKENLEKLKEEQSKGLSSLEKEFTAGHMKEKMQLQTMKDELERERGHIALDREHLEKRQLLLEDEVADRASEFIKCKRELEAQEREVREEMESLEKKLQQLKERQRDLLTRVSEEDEKIQTVSREFSSEHEQVEKAKAVMERKERDLQEQVSSLNQFQLSYDASLELHNKRKESTQSVVKQSEEEIDQHSEAQHLLEEAFAQSKEWSFEDISELLRPPDSLQSLFDREKLKEERLKETTSEVLLIRSSVTALSKKISDLEAQLPKLGEAKKVAVSARQYRDAAKLSSEEKELSTEIDKGKKEVAQMEEELSDKNDRLGTLNQELEELREERREAEKEADILCIDKLISSLKAVKHKLARISGTSQVSPLSTVLYLWSSFHKLLIEDLCTKHDLPLSDYLEVEEARRETADSESGDSSSLLRESENKEKDEESAEDVGVAGSGRNTTYEERTPGVGMEEPSKEGRDEDVVKELRERIEELEGKITTCCKNEEFELAAKLDDELTGIKSKLTEALSD